MRIGKPYQGRRGQFTLFAVLSIVGAVAAAAAVGQDRTETPQSAAALDANEVENVREAVVRYQATHLAPDDITPSALKTVVALCLGLEKSGGVDPSVSLLTRLKDVRPTVVAYSFCVKDGFRGRLPVWVTAVVSPSAAIVQARGRAVQNYYLYTLERQTAGWVVTRAQVTGRGAPAS